MPAPLVFPRSRTQQQAPLALCPARPEDYDTIQDLLDISTHAYSGLGGAMREAFQEDIALTAWQGERIVGFVLAHQQGPEATWIHGLGLASDVAQDTVGSALLEELEQDLAGRGVTWIGYMDEYRLGWMRRLLQRAGFRRRTHVVSYETPLHTPPSWGNPQVTVRPAKPGDIPTIALLDQAAFGLLWAYREQVFRTVLDQVAYFKVAEYAGELVGYILCTVYQGDHVHIVRLAVAPPWQRQGVGARLLTEMYDQMGRQGIRWVSLNTQAENVRSKHLYHGFGFRASGEEMEVWAKELARGRGQEAGGKGAGGRRRGCRLEH